MRLQAQRLKGSLTPTRLYLVRHGQVADGHTDRYHGNNDIGLSSNGVRQLEELAAQLTAVPLAGEAPKTIPIVEQTPLQVEVDETLARKWSGYPPAIN